MIDVAVSHVADHLNQFLRRTFDRQEDIVVQSNLVDLDGSVASGISNRIVILLVNVEKDTAPKQVASGAATGARVARKPRPLYLNLYLVVAGHFASHNYTEALKFLSTTIAYFQRQPVFDHSNTPDLDRRIERLTLEIANMEMHELSNLWSVIGGKYLPSVMYKLRMIVIDSDDVLEQIPTTRRPQHEVRP